MIDQQRTASDPFPYNHTRMFTPAPTFTVRFPPQENRSTHTIPIRNTLAQMFVRGVIREPFELVLHRLAEM